MKYYLVSGEASGDLHGANLMKALKKQDAQADFRFWGGDLMAAEGGENVSHYKERAYMGFLEVIKHLGTITSFIKKCKADLLAYKPDALILIDYPGFNLRIAKFAKENGIKVFYYISPQIWAWKEGRIKQIKAYVDHMFVILPFEKDFYAKHGMEVNFVGHPLLDAIDGIDKEETFLERNKLTKAPIIALLPGSRKQEISVKLPIMLSSVKDFSNYQFVIAGAPGIDDEYYKSFVANYSNVKFVKGDTYQLLLHSSSALVTSGTATLETALFKVPEVVCYKGSLISYWIAKQLIKIKFISLVNLIMDREVVKELIQGELNHANVKKELESILPGSEKREKMLHDYQLLIEKLGGIGASENTAKLIYQNI